MHTGYFLPEQSNNSLARDLTLLVIKIAKENDFQSPLYIEKDI